MRSGVRANGTRWFSRGGRFVKPETWRRSAGQQARHTGNANERAKLRQVIDENKGARARAQQAGRERLKATDLRPRVPAGAPGAGRFLPRDLMGVVRGKLVEAMLDGTADTGFINIRIGGEGGQTFRARAHARNIARAIGGGAMAASLAAAGREFDYDLVAAAADEAEMGGLDALDEYLAGAGLDADFEVMPDDV